MAKIIGTNVQKQDTLFDKQVRMWVYDEIVAVGNTQVGLCEYINRHHENAKYLPGIRLPDNVLAVPDLATAAQDCSLLVFVLPHQFVRKACDALQPLVKCGQTKAISLVKGVDASEDDEIQFVSETIGGRLGIDDVCVLMGANLASEVAQEQFCEATIGFKIRSSAETWFRLFNADYFRVRMVPDVKGVELYGSLKNIVGLAAGFVEGLGLGDNSKAAIMRIGLDEMRRFAQLVHVDVCEETIFESCGVADVITTCLGGRNRRVAQALVKTGKNIEELEAELLGGQKVQGPPAARQVYRILKDRQAEGDFPLFAAVYRICFQGLDPMRIIKDI